MRFHHRSPDGSEGYPGAVDAWVDYRLTEGRLTIELTASDGGTEVKWCQTFDTVAHYKRIAEFVAKANEQNLDRLALEVARGRAAPDKAS